VTRTIVAAPAGVGDDERVELKASVLCTRARELAGAAQDQNLEPCLSFTDCTPVEGPWVTTPQNGSNLQDVQCPSGLRAEGTDVVFSNSNGMDLVGTQTGGGLGPGMGRVLTFGAFGGQPTVVYKPAVGCLRSGATVFAARRGAPRPRPYRRRVRTVRIRPGRVVRVGLRCARGRRLVHSGSSVGFYTRRPPSPHIVRALKHRHRRSGPATRTVVSAPAGVGDDERVELQVSVTCSPAR
jgi:hypothetical protein